MLKSSYDALRQIQRQISTTSSLEEAKSLLKKHSMELIVEVSSSTVWVLEWDILKGTVKGVLDLNLRPQLKKDTVSIDGHKTLRVETSDALELSTLERQFMKTLHVAMQE